MKKSPLVPKVRVTITAVVPFGKVDIVSQGLLDVLQREDCYNGLLTQDAVQFHFKDEGSERKEV